MPDIKIYTTPSCVYCRMAKKYFSEHGVRYTEYDVSQNGEARAEMIEKSGQLGVPVIDIGGEVIVGFDEPALARLVA